MAQPVAGDGRIDRKLNNSFEGLRASKCFTKTQGEDADSSRSNTELQIKREHSKPLGKEAWNRKKQLALDTRKPRSTKPLTYNHQGRRAGVVTIIPDLESIFQPQPQRIFSAQEAQKAMKSVLERTLKDSSYDGPSCSRLTLDVAEAVKQAIRALGYERYKLVCYVVLGPVTRTGICCSSRSIWSPASDTYAEYVFRNSVLFAVCVVYAGYYE